MITTRDRPQRLLGARKLQELGKPRPCCVVRRVNGYLVEVVPGTSGSDRMVQQALPLRVEPDDVNGLKNTTNFVAGQRRTVDFKPFEVIIDSNGQILIKQYGILEVAVPEASGPAEAVPSSRRPVLGYSN